MATSAVPLAEASQLLAACLRRLMVPAGLTLILKCFGVLSARDLSGYGRAEAPFGSASDSGAMVRYLDQIASRKNIQGFLS